MKLLKHSAALAALSFGLCAVPQIAAAQTYDRLVVLGDSLSDNGNLYLSTNNTVPASPPFWKGRFSDGPVFTERLGFDAANITGPLTGSINMAFGGARTDNQAQPLGMQVQLSQYLARGGKFGRGDLVTVLGGANNIFQGLPAAGASANPTFAMGTVAQSAATDINGIVATIAQGGAGTILAINLPQMSITPQFRGTAGAPLADYAVNTFNTSLRNQLAVTAAANPNTNIIQMDIFGAGGVVAADPAAFGLTNVTAACFNGTTVCSSPGTYFYFDGVHPTAAGHAILALLAKDYMYYGELGSQVAVLGETAWRHRQDDLDIATDALSQRDGWDSGTRLSMSGLVDQVQVDARGVIAKSKANGYGMRVGLDSASEHWRLGLGGTYRRSNVKAVTMQGDVDTYALDVAAGWRDDNRFANLAVGGAANNYRNVKRITSLGPVVHESHATGTSFGARAQGGMWFEYGAWDLSPRVGVAWVTTDVGAFQENGPAADYRYLNRRLKAFTGEVTLRAEYEATKYGFYAEGGYRDNFSDDSEATRTGLVGNTAHVLSRDVDLPYGSQGLINLGLTGMIGERIQVDLGYRGRFGKHFHSNVGGLQFTLPLQ